MKSFNEYVEGIEGKGKGKMGYSPSKEDLEKWAEEDKKNKEHDERMIEIMKIAKANFDLAVDGAYDYKSLDDAVDSYALNAMDTAREQGFPDDAMEAQSAVYRLYDKYKEQLKNK